MNYFNSMVGAPPNLTYTTNNTLGPNYQQGANPHHNPGFNPPANLSPAPRLIVSENNSRQQQGVQESEVLRTNPQCLTQNNVVQEQTTPGLKNSFTLKTEFVSIHKEKSDGSGKAKENGSTKTPSNSSISDASSPSQFPKDYTFPVPIAASSGGSTLSEVLGQIVGGMQSNYTFAFGDLSKSSPGPAVLIVLLRCKVKDIIPLYKILKAVQ